MSKKTSKLSSTGSKVGSKIASAVDSSVASNAGTSQVAPSAVDSSVGGSKVASKVGSKVGSRVESQVGSSVDNAAPSAVNASQTGSAIESQVPESAVDTSASSAGSTTGSNIGSSVASSPNAKSAVKSLKSPTVKKNKSPKEDNKVTGKAGSKTAIEIPANPPPATPSEIKQPSFQNIAVKKETSLRTLIMIVIGVVVLGALVFIVMHFDLLSSSGPNVTPPPPLEVSPNETDSNSTMNGNETTPDTESSVRKLSLMSSRDGNGAGRENEPKIV